MSAAAVVAAAGYVLAAYAGVKWGSERRKRLDLDEMFLEADDERLRLRAHVERTWRQNHATSRPTILRGPVLRAVPDSTGGES